MNEQMCPVCGMHVDDPTLCANHLGISYYFCMPQCRENFLARPKLYLGQHAPQKQGHQIIKRRSFGLDQPVDAMHRDYVCAHLNQLMSVRNVRIEGSTVSIDYNLIEITAGQIEQALVEAGNHLGNGWAERLKRGWIHYTEENELDNLASGDAACCNKPPVKG